MTTHLTDHPPTTTAPRAEGLAHPQALEGIVRRRTAEQVGQTVLVVLLLAGLALALSLVLGRTGERIAAQMCVFVCAIVALGIFTGNSGIVSFGHAAFMAVGAYASGILTLPALMQRTALPQIPEILGRWELSPEVALLPVAAAGLLVALASGLAIARLRDASATIATLGFLIIIHSLLIGAREITRGSQTFFGVPRVTTFEVALAAAVVFILLARLFRESRWGLMLRAVRDDEAAAAALGIDPQRMRLIAWTASGALAAVAGALYAHLLGAYSPATFYFALTFSMVAMLIIGGMTTVSGAVLGVVCVTLLQDTVRQFEGGFSVAGVELPAVFGLTTVVLGLATLLVIWRRPAGLTGHRELSLPGFWRAIAPLVPHRTVPLAPPAATPQALEVRNVSLSFAGLKAVDGASFTAPAGTVTGLIGPNGAGKSTMVNLLSGQLHPDEGSMVFGTTELATLKAHKVAPLGLARTFQNIRLFNNLTVYENVLVAALASGRSRAEAGAVALREIATLHLTAEAMAMAGALPYGARKRLEIARCLALEPTMILLDEPAAGMNPEETADLAARLRSLCEERGIGLLLIDHDLDFVHRLSSAIVVMNRGAVIAAASPDEIRADPKVIEAYIGRGRAGRDPGVPAENHPQPQQHQEGNVA